MSDQAQTRTQRVSIKTAVNVKPKGSALTQAERTEISDQSMLEATVKLVVERGPAGTSLKDVGVLAGYSRGLASQRFGSKDKLFSFVVRRLGRLWLAQLKTVTEDKTGLNAVEHAIDEHYRFCLDAPDYVRTLYTLWFEAVTSESQLSITMNDIHQRRFRDVVNWIVDAPDINESVKIQAESIAAQFSATVVGLVYYWISNPEKVIEIKDLHEGLKRTMNLLLRP